LKLPLFPGDTIRIDVAPYTGAWIETTLYLRVSVRLIVAPYTGAWIETVEAVSNAAGGFA